MFRAIRLYFEEMRRMSREHTRLGLRDGYGPPHLEIRTDESHWSAAQCYCRRGKDHPLSERGWPVNA